MSASKMLFGYTLNEKNEFTVESTAKTPFLLFECSMSHVLSLFLAFLQDCRHLEETLEHQS